MKALKKILKILAMIVLIAAVFLSLYLPPLATSRPPVGNEYALLECQLFLRAATFTKTNSHFFEFSKLSSEERHRALIMTLYLDLLVKTNFAWADNSNHEIVAVCPHEFGNMPRPMLLNLYHKNRAHAVGYSDGTAGLISLTEFKNLNLSSFVSAANLATNSEFNIFTK